jgi:hypothetical protein
MAVFSAGCVEPPVIDGLLPLLNFSLSVPFLGIGRCFAILIAR